MKSDPWHCSGYIPKKPDQFVGGSRGRKVGDCVAYRIRRGLQDRSLNVFIAGFVGEGTAAERDSRHEAFARLSE